MNEWIMWTVICMPCSAFKAQWFRKQLISAWWEQVCSITWCFPDWARSNWAVRGSENRSQLWLTDREIVTENESKIVWGVNRLIDVDIVWNLSVLLLTEWASFLCSQSAFFDQNTEKDLILWNIIAIADERSAFHPRNKLYFKVY